MKTDQKLGLTEGLLALVCALLIWQTQLLLSVSKEVVALQVHRTEHERRIQNLEDKYESSTPSLPPSSGGSTNLPSGRS